jgi:hypothetical protein
MPDTRVYRPLQCEECPCLSEDGTGWIAKVIENREEEPHVVTYCPDCAARIRRVTPSTLDHGRRSPKKLLRAVVARLLRRSFRQPLGASAVWDRGEPTVPCR